MATKDLPQTTWSLVDFVSNTIWWTISSVAVSRTLGTKFSIYKRGYGPLKCTGIRFHYAGATPAIIRAALWRLADVAPLASVDIVIAATGVHTVSFAAPYLFVDTDYYRTLRASTFNLSAAQYTRADFTGPGAPPWSDNVSYPFVSGPGLFIGQPSVPPPGGENGFSCSVDANANPTANASSVDHSTVEPIIARQ